MKVSCIKCKRILEASNINVAKDTAYCPHCENLTSLSSLLDATPSKYFDVQQPVCGITVSVGAHRYRVIYASGLRIASDTVKIPSSSMRCVSLRNPAASTN